MNVLIIPEDVVKDGYVLKPIVSRMLHEAGAVHTNIRVCFILCVDRDGEEGRRQSLDYLEGRAADILPADRLYLAVDAWQEVEVWVLAGLDLPPHWKWSDVRQERHPKEVYFDTFARLRGVEEKLGGGRKELAEEAARRYGRIRRRCPEDVRYLENRVVRWLEGKK
jgi:hypothetical protein